MAYELLLRRQFVKDAKRLKKAGWDMKKLNVFMQAMRKSPPFPKHYEIHPLRGDLEGTWDAHITQNWIVLFQQPQKGVIELLRTGTHQYVGLS